MIGLAASGVLGKPSLERNYTILPGQLADFV
jgi:hypothetical protein